jgi:D-alanine-D-alanine ligase
MLSKEDKIVIICGGWSSEKEISLMSGKAIYQSLIKAQYNAILINMDRNIVQKLQELKPDIAFNALHGKFGEDGKINAILELLEIPLTHCSLLASAIAINKVKTKEFCSDIDGLNNIPYAVLKENNPNLNKNILTEFSKPFIVKPICEGSSCGVLLVKEGDSFSVDNLDWSYGNELLIEKYIKGKEVAVGIFKDKAIGVIEIKAINEFYDYDAKYITNSQYIMPADIKKETYNQALNFALKCHQKIGCEFVSRVDMLVEENSDKIFLLEINTHPGMTTNSLLPKIAAYCGISFLEIIIELLNHAKAKEKKFFS